MKNINFNLYATFYFRYDTYFYKTQKISYSLEKTI